MSDSLQLLYLNFLEIVGCETPSFSASFFLVNPWRFNAISNFSLVVIILSHPLYIYSIIKYYSQ